MEEKGEKERKILETVMRLKEALGNSMYTGLPYLFLCLFFNDLPGMFHSQ